MSNSIWMTGDSLQSRALARDAVAIGEALADLSLTVVASYYLGAAAFTMGNYGETEAAFRRVLESLRDHPRHERFGMTGFPGAISHSYLAWSLGERGRFGTASLTGKRAFGSPKPSGSPSVRPGRAGDCLTLTRSRGITRRRFGSSSARPWYREPPGRRAGA